MMNDEAQRLGCTNTHFANTHGLHDDAHYTTARRGKAVGCRRNLCDRRPGHLQRQDVRMPAGPQGLRSELDPTQYTRTLDVDWVGPDRSGN